MKNSLLVRGWVLLPVSLAGAVGMMVLFLVLLSDREKAFPDETAAASPTSPGPELITSESGSVPVFGPQRSVPGGVPVGPADSSVPPVAIVGDERSARVFARDHESPALRLEQIHRRTRIFSLAESLDLRPPAIGEERRAARRLAFDLFPDVSFVGRIERLERRGHDRAVYFGSLEGVPGGDFILGYNRGAVVASFTTPGRGSFQIRYVGAGNHAAIELDPSAFPSCQVDGVHAVPNRPSPRELSQIRTRAALHETIAASAGAPVDGGVYGGFGQQGGDRGGLAFTEIDLMIVHTTAATSAAGGHIGIEAVIDVSVARANSAFINSDIGLRLNLVRTEEVAYTEVSQSDDLSNLREGNGALSNVPAWRNQSGADLVSLFVSGSGGLAYIFNESADLGFSLTGLAGAEATFVHEIGHNLGCLHDRENNDRTSLYPYAFGWRFTPDEAPEVRTVMAYSPGASIPYFSNPEITYMGTSTGILIGETNESHNAQVIRNTMNAVANFRSAAGNVPPSVTLGSPGYRDPLIAMDSVHVTATANDSDGSVVEVRFYRLKSDNDFGFSNRHSWVLGSDVAAPYGVIEELTPAGFWTYAAVAIDNDGGIAIDTVSVTVAPHYRSQALALPDGKLRVNVEGINEQGRLVGFGHNGNSNATDTQAAYWENGSITLLNPLGGDTGAKAWAVGRDGLIYGESISGGGSRRAVAWKQSATPIDISGVIPGYTANAAIGVDEWHRIYLESGGNDFRRFDDPGFTDTGTNERFTKVSNTGSFTTGHDYDFDVAAFVAMRWQETGTRLASLPGSLSSWGRAVNRHGSVFGFSGPQANGFQTATNRLSFWPAGETEPVDLGGFGDDGGWAYDLNDFNHAVGSANHPELGGVGMIWKGEGDLLNINQVMFPVPGLIREARAINNRGQVAVTGFSGADQILYLLEPLPGLSHDYWLSTHFSPEEIEAGDITGDLHDPDGDGIPNLLERALGLDPRVPYTASGEDRRLPEIVIEEDGHLHFVIRRLRVPRDVGYIPEATFNLASGNWDENLLEVFSVTPINADFEEVILRTTVPVDQEESAFARLRLER